MGLSLRPSTFVEGGGLIDDVDVKVTAAKFLMFDYQGKADVEVPALGLTIVDPDGKEHDQFFSAGDAKFFMPGDGDTPAREGDELVATGDKAALNTNTNLAKFLESLVNAGWPEDKLDDFKASSLVGLEFHIKREAAKRTGLIRTGKNAGRESTVFTCSKIIRYPWEKAKAGVAAKAPAATVAASKPNGKAAPAPANDEVAAIAQEQVMAILLENDGSLAKNKLATAVFGAMKGDANQKAVSQLLMKDDFLKSIEGVSIEGGVVSLG